MKLIHIAALFSTLLLASQASAGLADIPSGNYQVDKSHAYLNLQYNHLGLSNPTIGLDDFDASLQLDAADIANSSVEVSIDMNSIIAGSEIWKKHLSGTKFFDVSAYGLASFRSTSISAKGENNYTVEGELTVKNITKAVSLNVSLNNAMMHPMSGKPVIGLDASGQILRSDFGLGVYAPNISDEVMIQISMELVQN